jgi:hypothetical protein
MAVVVVVLLLLGRVERPLQLRNDRLRLRQLRL